MKTIVDIVNFNADASSLSSKRWLEILKGGKDSLMYRYLELYIKNNHPVTFGIIGSSAIEMSCLNPECVELINENPHVFEIVNRPFIHDLALFWNQEVFSANVILGQRILKGLFNNVNDFYLPPEFVLKNSQISLLKEMGLTGVFTHLDRMKADHKRLTPKKPYMLKGLFDSSIKCIPLLPNATKAYLKDIQLYSTEALEEVFKSLPKGVHYFWRDGESPFLLPETLEREAFFLKFRPVGLQYDLLTTTLAKQEFIEPTENQYPNYPVISLIPWMEDFRFYWYLTDLKRTEDDFNAFSRVKKVLFLTSINSDILSSIEKNSVQLILRSKKSPELAPFIIHRKAKHVHGAEFLEMLSWNDDRIVKYLSKGQNPYHRKVWLRYKYISENGLI